MIECHLSDAGVPYKVPNTANSYRKAKLNRQKKWSKTLHICQEQKLIEEDTTREDTFCFLINIMRHLFSLAMYGNACALKIFSAVTVSQIGKYERIYTGVDEAGLRFFVK